MNSIEMSAFDHNQRENGQDVNSECTSRIGSSYGDGTIDGREEEERNIMHLARTLTRPSGVDGQHKNPFFENSDPALDPHVCLHLRFGPLVSIPRSMFKMIY